MLVDADFSEDLMQQLAMEMNLSETAFVFPEGDNYRIRYFTPTKEVALCGHATLASAHIMYEKAIVKESDPIVFIASGGTLHINKNKEFLVMNFPQYKLEKVDISLDFSNLVGFEPVEIYSSSYGWIILVAATAEEILQAKPVVELLTANGLGHLMITAQGLQDNIDFVLRCFAPISGINEDPVTGSAHCALSPLWASKLKKTELVSKQVSQRTGDLKTRIVGERVEIMGQAVTVFEARLRI
jgi:PhzF family phenazine biosynthesis protein